MRAVKITNVDSQVMFEDARIAEAMDFLASVGINTVVPVVWNSNGANGDFPLYPSAVFERYFGTAIHPRFAGRDALERIVIEAHRNGMEVLPWFEMGFSTSYSQNGGHILQKYPDWALRDKTGKLVVKNGFDWMSNIHPGPQALIREMTEEVVVNYDVDGIEYSDRIPAMPYEGGYEPYTVALYQKEHGGANPPDDPKDPAWVRWRADKLNEWFRSVREVVKKHGTHLTVAASPSLYPWAYAEYLQDSPTWMKDGLADEVIPQLYRYNFNDYTKELNLSLSYNTTSSSGYYAGVLMKVGSYLISADYLSKLIETNRAKGVLGEVYFFYEGFRAQNNALGNLLKETAYAKPAFVPGRKGGAFRPPATFSAFKTPISGTWSALPKTGFKNTTLWGSEEVNAQMAYSFLVPFSAWFDVYAHQSADVTQTTHARYQVFGKTGETGALVNQTDAQKNGWQKIGSVYLEKGMQQVVRLEHGGTTQGILSAGEVMLMINRKKSPDVVVNNLADQPTPTKKSTLLYVFPNPSSRIKTIQVNLENASPVLLEVYDLNGSKVAKITEEICPEGLHEWQWIPADSLPAAVYLLRLTLDNLVLNRRIIHLKGNGIDVVK
ncbi:MAG: family 10 glycosylhydrolase [Bacteroidetes Order II. Incertae sedis bacterium]|nr:family 10 glycosylhydrolase [Bacteroidetes Order II. bacterium]